MLNRIYLWLRDHFIPSETNGDKPHFLRTGSAQALLFGVFGIQAAFLFYTYVVLPSSASLSAIFATVLVDQTNQERAKFDIPALTKSEALSISAQAKADDMANRGYFSHYTPEGAAPWKFIHDAGYQYRTAGENLAVNFVDSHDVTEAWMNSPTHRANLLAGKYTEVGIATARGAYQGRDAIFVVQHFGTPLYAALATKKGVPQTAITGTSQEVATPTATTTLASNAGTSKPTSVLGVTTDARAPLVLRLLTEPRRLSEYMQFGVAILALFALLLAFFIRIRIQHPIILANGIMILSVSLLMTLVNVLITRGSI